MHQKEQLWLDIEFNACRIMSGQCRLVNVELVGKPAMTTSQGVCLNLGEFASKYLGPFSTPPPSQH